MSDPEKDIDEETFAKIVEEEWSRVPERYRAQIENVALLVEDEPSDEVRTAEGLKEGESLFGLYQGIPRTERGESYGTGMTLPDTITIYRLPTMLEAEDLLKDDPEDLDLVGLVREIVRDTLWHEIGHYFGWGEEAIGHREEEGSNEFGLL